MKITADQIRRLREESGAPMLRVKKVLEQERGNEEKALAILRKEGFEKAESRTERVTASGIIEAYTHHSGKVVSVVEVLCETDFVAKNDLFKALAHDLALQVASTNPKDAKALLEEEFIKDQGQKIVDLVKSVIAKTGENVKVSRIYRLELGKN